MSLFKLSNQIFGQGLSVKELCVYTYLCSIRADEQTLNREAVVHVKQTTIGENCGISSVQTVKKVISGLIAKGFVTQLQRSVKHGGYKGTYYYGIKQLPMTDGYFYAERRVFGQLVPRQLFVYLFICKSFSPSLGYCWNSYNDIAAQTGMKREVVIQTVNELVKGHFIVRYHRRSKENKKVFVDNRYSIVLYVRGSIKKKKLMCKISFFGVLTEDESSVKHNITSTVYHRSGELSSVFSGRGSPECNFFGRGSPENVAH
ncbi:MAG: hypothetical protein IKQ91_01760 [Oscillospiraceae bacterium]|nr:hypothetical protein [Oscillospiraceae bacterium]MBR4199988.1 hypothetical protein [Oscillospiraceae bacterium]